MSAFTAMYHLDGRLVDPDALQRMTDAARRRGPDDGGQWIGGPVGLGHRALHTTPESPLDPQPLWDEAAGLCLTLDGRVDNREDLIADLQARGARLRSKSDAELLLRAYECWGEACIARIIGDFAFVLWDGRKRQLFCGRDFLGIRPFYYYYAGGRTFIAASELHQLFAGAPIPRVPNEGMIAEYLSAEIASKEETLYQGIMRLEPAHFLLVDQQGLRKMRYWDVDLQKQIRYGSDAEYAEQFRAIFREAVRCRMRSNGPVGAHLSGGMDSSSVTAMAEMLRREGAVVDHGFETFSQVYPGLPCDEREYIQPVVDMWNLRANLIDSREHPETYYVDQIRHYLDFPEYPNGASNYRLNTLAREKGFRVLLTGDGGNQWLEGYREHLADLLRARRIRDTIHQAWCDSGRSSVSAIASSIVFFGVRPLLPRRIRRPIGWLRRRTQGTKSALDWLSPDFIRRTRLEERLQSPGRTCRSGSIEAGTMYVAGVGGWQIHVNELVDRDASWFGLEHRHPLNDRRLVEFAFGLPGSQRWRGEERKLVLRRAMVEKLPATVIQRRVQGEFSVLFILAMRTRAGVLAGSPVVERAGFVSGEQAWYRYRSMTRRFEMRDPEYTKHIWPLWALIAIELWYRDSFDHGAGVEAPRYQISNGSIHGHM